MEENLVHVEIRGIYDGVCFTFNKETKDIIWRDVVVNRTTEEYRKDFEIKFKENFK